MNFEMSITPNRSTMVPNYKGEVFIDIRLSSNRDDKPSFRGASTLVLLDASSSMIGPKWDTARSILMRYIDESKQNEMIDVITFGLEVELISGYQKSMLKEKIASITPDN
ncbi:MAG: hypothetical protein ACP5T1_07490, partial [Thermoplasmata archaeon]